MNRHTCIICKRKRYANKMEKAFLNSYVCNDNLECKQNKEIEIGKQIIVLYGKLKKINKMHLFGK